METVGASGEAEAAARDALARAVRQLDDARSRLAAARGEGVAQAALDVKRAQERARAARLTLESLARLPR